MVEEVDVDHLDPSWIWREYHLEKAVDQEIEMKESRSVIRNEATIVVHSCADPKGRVTRLFWPSSSSSSSIHWSSIRPKSFSDNFFGRPAATRDEEDEDEIEGEKSTERSKRKASNVDVARKDRRKDRIMMM